MLEYRKSLKNGVHMGCNQGKIMATRKELPTMISICWELNPTPCIATKNIKAAIRDCGFDVFIFQIRTEGFAPMG
jgi:hypothetical protein